MAGLQVWTYVKYSGTVIGIALAVYYGPRKMLETWDWYLDRFLDSGVRHALNQRRSPMKQIEGGRYVRWGLGVRLADLAIDCGISEKGCRKRLRRLEKRGEAIDCHDDYWRAPDKYEG